KDFSCNALADLSASINVMLYSLYAKLSLETLKPTKMSVSINVIDEILEESVEGTILEEKLFAEFDEFMAMNIKEDNDSESKIEEPPLKKITFNTDYKIKTSLEEPPSILELKPLPNHLEYEFLEEPSFLSIIISYQLYEKKKISSSLF
ncbi:hypothetical protein Tco_1414750, partial [Tanacetum coccineum]